MPRSPDELDAGEWAVLALLAEEPTHGFAVGRALAAWLLDPVDHMRDARSLLMLKLLFLVRRGEDPASLLAAQGESFAAQAQRLSAAAEAAEDFDQVLIRWRLESTTAAIRFIESLLERPA